MGVWSSPGRQDLLVTDLFAEEATTQKSRIFNDIKTVQVLRNIARESKKE